MARSMWFSLFVVASLLGISFGFGFNPGLLSECAIQGSQEPGETIVCRAGNVCPDGTNSTVWKCPQDEVCCRGEPVCVGIDCNNGTCVDNVCECDDGFNGTFCTVDMCETGNNDCSVNSDCNRLAAPDLYNCTCHDGYSGLTCDVDACAFNGLCANGACVREPLPALASCSCFDGFSGPICDVDACEPLPCENGGTCTREPLGDYTCACVGEWFGRNCTETSCDDLPCENGGTCIPDTPTEYHCNCALNFTGETCAESVCIGDRSQCSGNGDCVPTIYANYTCVCDEGFSGDDCSFEEPLCGVEGFQSRLANGDDDFENGNPWLVKIKSSGIVYCSGVLVAHNYVVTDAVCAAYCNIDHCTATVGDWDNTVDEPNELVLGVIDKTFHENVASEDVTEIYGLWASDITSTLGNNIALLELETPIVKNTNVNTPCSPQGFEATRCNQTCKLASFGWSDPEIFTPLVATKRQTLPVRPIADDLCKYTRNLTTMPVAAKCGFIEKEDAGSCFADNGGAVVCLDEITRRWSLEGLMAFFPHQDNGHCSKQIFMYTDIEALWPWIAARIP